MLTPGVTENSFYLDGQLIDTVMLDYQNQRKHNGGRLHIIRQAICKLRYVAYEVNKGYSVVTSEKDIQKWVADCS